MTNGNNIPVNIRPAVYCTALHENGQAEFDFLWTKYLQSNIPTESVVLLNALGCTGDSESLKVYLKYCYL